MSESEVAVRLFRALSDPTRLALLQLLMFPPREGGCCVNSLARHLDVSQPAVSQHLRVLRELGLAVGNRRGYRVHYTVDRERLDELRAVADQVLTVDETWTGEPCKGWADGESHCLVGGDER